MNLNTKIIRKNEFMTADMDGSAVTMNPYTGKYYDLGKTGGYIWNQLQTAKTVKELVEALCSAFSISPEVCEADVLPFLQDLLEKGMLDILE